MRAVGLGLLVVAGTLLCGSPCRGADLSAWYPFEGTADDASGNGNDGVVYGATLTIDCLLRQDNAYDFDGVWSHIQVADSPTLRPSTLTVCFWTCVRSLTSGPSLAESFINKRVSGRDNSFSMHMGTNPFDDNYQRPTWQLNGGMDEVRVIAPDTMSLGVWHHVAGTFDGSVASLYVDGVWVKSRPYTSAIYYDGGEVEIGAIYGGDLQHVDGRIDDVRIYRGVLAPAEIQDLASTCGGPSAVESGTWGRLKALLR